MQYLFGKKAVIEAIKNTDTKMVLFTKNHRDLIKLCKIHKINFKIVDESFFDKKYSNNFNHQYVSCEVSNFQVDDDLETYLKENPISQILILDSIEDPFNFGAILRNAAAFNFNIVIYKKNHQVQINDYVVKTSIGAINKLKLFRVANLINVINFLKKNNYWIYSSSLNDKSQNLGDLKFTGNIALVIGNEQKGISKLVLENSDFFIKIPISEKVQSLNASTAAGILMFYINSKKS